MTDQVEGLLQVALKADDLDAAEAFYRRVLGVAPAGRFEPPGLLFFVVGAVRLLLEGGAPAGAVYLRVADVGAAQRRAVESGAQLVSEPHVIFRHVDDALGPAGHDEQHAFVRDPSGNLLGFVALVPTPA
ncbi:MAG TPA: VOC family protein [Trueperaceae bacterium]|nr:VOC family protein [Trueperaceae bacterium]